jgi:hypothetical protein
VCKLLGQFDSLRSLNLTSSGIFRFKLEGHWTNCLEENFKSARLPKLLASALRIVCRAGMQLRGRGPAQHA